MADRLQIVNILCYNIFNTKQNLTILYVLLAAKRAWTNRQSDDSNYFGRN